MEPAPAAAAASPRRPKTLSRSAGQRSVHSRGWIHESRIFAGLLSASEVCTDAKNLLCECSAVGDERGSFELREKRLTLRDLPLVDCRRCDWAGISQRYQQW